MREFGAFINLGAGVEGLLHVSEMGWSRVAGHVAVVKPGEDITVKVLRVDETTQKIALGLKQLTGDPWSRSRPLTRSARCAPAASRASRSSGRSSSWSRASRDWRTRPRSLRRAERTDGQSVAVDMTGAFEILSIHPEKKRIGVALVPEGSREATPRRRVSPPIVPGARLTGKVERHEKFGVFVFLAPGRTGLVPLSETGITRDADVAKAFPVGSDIEVIVLDVESAGRRIRLSRKAVQDAQEAKELSEMPPARMRRRRRDLGRSPTSCAARSRRGRSNRHSRINRGGRNNERRATEGLARSH